MPLRYRAVFLFPLFLLFAGPLYAVEKAGEAETWLAELQQAHGDCPLLAVQRGELLWGSDEHPFVVHRAADGSPRLATAIGQVRIQDRLFAAPDAVVAGDLAALVDAAAEEGRGAERGDGESGLLYRESILLGRHLFADEEIVTAFGTYDKKPVEGSIDERAADALAQLERVVAEAEAAVDAQPINRLGKKTLYAILDLLAEDNSRDYAADEVTPEFARRVVLDGWWRRMFGDAELADRLEAAVHAAMELRPVWRFVGEQGTVAHVADPFGTVGYVIVGEGVNRYGANSPVPFYHWPLQGDDGLEDALVVVDLETGADPLHPTQGDAAAALRIAYHYRGERLALWTPDAGLEFDGERWRTLIPATHRRLDQEIVADYLPPHIPIPDLHGNVLGIVVPAGMLRPPAEPTEEEARRFIDDAAAMLPGAAYLDLIGQYLFRYVYDSPDPRQPLLMGNPEVKADIHQTATETLSTVAGGQCRGDCDDLSELYEQIAEKQGRTAHVISLPAHAAMAYARREGDRWHVYVMQTGPTLEFVHEELPEALRQAYQHFDASEIFDPHGLGLLLRFSGENTRSAWRLSYRIFSEPDYAETMINVQRDWHFQTYLQGINKMLRMIEEGDHDTANYRELSGLYSFTGQYAKAAEYHAEAIERTEEADSRLFMKSELVQHLLDAGEEAQAKKLVEEILTGDLPPLREQLGLAEVNFGLQLTSFLIEHREQAQAAAVYQETVLRHIASATDNLAAWLEENYADGGARNQWERSAQMHQYRRMLRMAAGTGIALLTLGPPGNDPALRETAKMVRTWIDGVAFYDVDDVEDVMQRYAQVGSYYQAMIGEDAFAATLAAADLPDDPHRNHRDRDTDVAFAQLSEDLGWIKASIAYWQGRIGEQVADHVDGLDREAFGRNVAGFEAALTATRKLGIDGAFQDRQIIFGRFLIALLGEDAATVREILAEVEDLDDKRIRDNVTRQIGDVARFMRDEWFDEVFGIWREILDYKPKYLWIAWRAALHDAPGKALRVAEVAAEKFADDQAFVDEYKFMRELFAEEGREVEASAP